MGSEAQDQPVPQSGREALMEMRAEKRKAERLQLREERAAHMLMRRLVGQKLEQIADEFAVSKTTVAAEINWARQRHMQHQVRTYMEERLWPKGLAGLEVHLDNGNYEAIRDLFQGTGVWNKNVAVTSTHQLGEGVETFEAWRISRRSPQQSQQQLQQPQSQLPAQTAAAAVGPTTHHDIIDGAHVIDGTYVRTDQEAEHDLSDSASDSDRS